MLLCAFCKKDGRRFGVVYAGAAGSIARVGATFDGARWEAHGRLSEAEFSVVLEVMDARLEVVSELHRTLVKPSDGP